MLVIRQQEGEILQIGTDIRILIRQVKGGWVRLCIDAPREIPIQRVRPAETPRGDEAGPQEVVVRRRRRARSASEG